MKTIRIILTGMIITLCIIGTLFHAVITINNNKVAAMDKIKTTKNIVAIAANDKKIANQASADKKIRIKNNNK